MKYLKTFESFESIKFINNDARDNTNKEGYFNGMKILRDPLKNDSYWEPLYLFLKHIFGDNYMNAADGFMWYGEYDTLYVDVNNKPIIYNQYRHGITRQWIEIMEDGEPIEIEFKYSNEHHFISNIKSISYVDSFKKIYKNLDKILDECENNCNIPKELHYIKYEDFKILRDKILNKKGYNVVSVSSEDDFNKLKESQGKYSKVSNNTEILQYTNSIGGEINKKPKLDGELVDEDDEDIVIPTDIEITGHIGAPIKSIRVRKNSKEPIRKI